MLYSWCFQISIASCMFVVLFIPLFLTPWLYKKNSDRYRIKCNKLNTLYFWKGFVLSKRLSSCRWSVVNVSTYQWLYPSMMTMLLKKPLWLFLSIVIGKTSNFTSSLPCLLTVVLMFFISVFNQFYQYLNLTHNVYIQV